MAFQFPKIDLTDAKTRIFIIVAGLIGFVVLIYIGRQFFTSPTSTAGPSHLAKAPTSLQSVPGGQLTPEYYRALVQANAQAAKQAQISGGSAVPTLLNEPGAQPGFQQSSSSCSVVCPTDDNVNVENEINELVKAGKLPEDEGKKLIDLAKKNIAVSEFAALLDETVKRAILTPNQARKLLNTYKKQHENNLLYESAAVLDALIKAGQLPIDSANDLLGQQKKQVLPGEYADALSDLVQTGKISAQTAVQLLAQYTQQYYKEAFAEAIGQLKQMAVSGQISSEVAKELEGYLRRQVSQKEYEEELQHLVKQDKLTPEQARRLLAQYRLLIPAEIANELADFQKRNVSVGDYQAELQKLVAAGKISPQQAQQLLDEYRQVKAAGATQGTMGDLVKQAERANEEAVKQLAASGKISSETAQQLMDLQHSKVPIEDYKKKLNELVQKGKLDPADAERLLVSYLRQKGAGVQDLLASRKISPETAQKLMELQQANAPVEQYKQQLDKMVREGKISPTDAELLLNNYAQMKQGSEKESAQEQKMGNEEVLQNLVSTHRLPPATEQKLLEMQKSNVPIEDYKKALDQMVKEGKISPQEGTELLNKYQKLHGIREEADRLGTLRANNAPLETYVTELKRAVEAGTLSPEEANRLMQEYQAAQVQPTGTTTALPNVEGSKEFAALQKRIQAAGPTAAPLKPITAPAITTLGAPAESAAQGKAKAMAEQQEQQRLQALMGAMSQQAGQLINSWQPPLMAGQVGSTEKDLPQSKAAKGGENKETLAGMAGSKEGLLASPLIKAGTIIYAILDTAVNSDYPDSPVLATVVSGPYKGAKLLGKLAITQGQDRVSLTFKLMNKEEWSAGKSINAYAIDPDTARTALASNVNYHYFLRYGSLFASSFLSGYASAVSSSGATTSLSVTGSTTTNPVLSPSSKLMVGLGEVGKTLSKAAQSYSNTPPTVKIDPGVSLGILFMSDVSG